MHEILKCTNLFQGHFDAVIERRVDAVQIECCVYPPILLTPSHLINVKDR